MEQKQSLSEGSRFVSLPLIKRGLLEERTYQIEVAKNSAAQNTLVVLPTGLGKTAIAALIIAEFLSRSPDSRALVLAPTRVLVNQHYSFFVNHLDLHSNEIAILTGEDPTPIRDSVWSKRLVCATPQVTVVELEKRKFKIEDFSLIIFDEVHRAVGNYAYTQIASMYNEFRKDGRIIGMTASLPSDRTKIEEILAKLKITKIETRDEKSNDVKPFVFK
ncbi:MAG TPA: DEAD/DEAH box helicase, partial [Nitrososphaerales archaeon]|nr:DEAD/DEAH box helicase [Nitrososphaerales archaeon]